MTNDPLQTTINRMSLVMTIPEDLVKACKENDLSPKFVETLLRLHNQQVELEKVINELRTSMVKIAQTVESHVDASAAIQQHLIDMGKSLGYDENEKVSSEEIGVT